MPGKKMQSSEEEQIAGGVVKQFEALRGKRGNLDSHCQEISEKVWPSQSKLFQGQNAATDEGEKRSSNHYDATASSALNKFASILDSLLTPMNQTWHRIVPDDPYLLKDRATVLWMEELNRCLFKKRYAPTANFVPQNQLVYKGLGAWGTSAIFTDELRGRRGEVGRRYKNIHLSELYMMENHQGIVEEIYRFYKSTALQVVKRFGENNVPEKMVEKSKKSPDDTTFLVHCVKPREDVDYSRADHKGMEFVSFYVLYEEKWLLEEGGYESFPYAVSRYEQTPGEVYGRSPAMEALPAIKTLDEEKKTVLTHGHRAIAPPLFAYDDGVLDTYNIRPGTTTFGGVNADGKLLVHSMPVGNIMIGKELMDDERDIINDLFLVPLFQMLEENPQMTATEVVERTKEKGILLSPTVGRQYNEYHGRMIEREIDLELRQNRMLRETMPPALVEAGGEYRLRYDSPMARMQRMEEASGVMRTVETALNIATQTQNPAVLDHFNFDVIIPQLADIGGVPREWLNDPKAIEATRAGRAEQMQKQEEIQEAPGQAALIKATSVARKARAA